MDILEWISEWYNFHCDNNWEHDYGYRIYTLDNPGIMIEIDLIETNQEGLEIKEVSNVVDEVENWFTYRVENQKFIGMGDPSKLSTLLTTFKGIVDENGGYHFIKLPSRIIAKYSRYDGFQSENSISVPFRKLRACVKEFLENNVGIESIQVVRFTGQEGEVIQSFSSVDEVKELEGEFHYFVNVKKM